MTEREFSEKYCKKCSSLVCRGTVEEATEGCKDYRREVLGWQELKGFEVPRIKPEKFSVELKLGNLVINLKDVTLQQQNNINRKEGANSSAILKGL